MQIDEISTNEADTIAYRELFEQDYYYVVAQADMLLARGDTRQEVQLMLAFKMQCRNPQYTLIRSKVVF